MYLFEGLKMKLLVKQFTLVALLASIVGVNAKNIEYVEDDYAVQAAPELVQQVDRVANLVDFMSDYEVVSSKEFGVEVHPANRFIASVVNPATKNLRIIVNADWFNGLTIAEQDFLIARCLVRQQQGGALPKSVKFMPWVFALLTIGLLFSIFFVLRSIKFLTLTSLIKLPIWGRIAALVAIVVSIEFLIFDPVQANLVELAVRRHNLNISSLAIDKTGDKASAIQALNKFDIGVKAELANGEAFWKPFENTFSNIIKDLGRPICHHGHDCKH